jgi:uncharacterized glyoxalase superfamily protein PhnB
MYTWEALADDAGVAAGGSGFRGFTLSYIVDSADRVDAVSAGAERAGGDIAKPARRALWGGYSGYFTDPSGYLWKLKSRRARDVSVQRRSCVTTWDGPAGIRRRGRWTPLA